MRTCVVVPALSCERNETRILCLCNKESKNGNRLVISNSKVTMSVTAVRVLNERVQRLLSSHGGHLPQNLTTSKGPEKEPKKKHPKGDGLTNGRTRRTARKQRQGRAVSPHSGLQLQRQHHQRRPQQRRPPSCVALSPNSL